MKVLEYLSIEESVSLPVLSSLSLSQDGGKIAYVRETADWEGNEYKNHIWIYEDNGKTPYKLNLDEEVFSPQWSPDSITLAFIKNLDGKNQIFIKRDGEDKVIQATNISSGVTAFKWSPQGKGFYFITRQPEKDYIIKRRKLYGDFSITGDECRQNSLCYAELGTNNSDFQYKTIVEGDFYIHAFAFSKDMNRMVLLASPTADAKDNNSKDIYIYYILGKITVKLDVDAIIGPRLIISPDGRKICYTRTIRERSFYEYNKKDSVLEIYNIDTNERIQPLKPVDNSLFPLQWTEVGILLTWKDKMNTMLALLSDNGELRVVSSNDGSMIQEADLTSDGKHLACIKAEPMKTYEIYLDNKKVTDENDYFTGRISSKKELVSWKNPDGFEIQGILSLPLDFKPGTRYPMIVVCGGSSLTATQDKYFPIEQFVAKGFVVFEPDRRGYWGYGLEFSKADFRKLGIAYCEDVLAGIDSLVKRGIADDDRIGITGFSEGGYTAVFSSFYSGRFKAVSCYAAVSSWVTEYISCDVPFLSKQELGCTPWDDREIYEKTSPITYVKSVNAPVLIMHKEFEPRVPVVNAYELYRGLKDTGAKAEMVIFREDEHFDSTPGINRAIMKLNLKWFSHYILGEAMANIKEFK